LQGILLSIAFIVQQRSVIDFSLPDNDSFKLLLRYSLIALAGNLLYFFMYKIDYWFVRYYCSQLDLGNYIQAAKLAQMVLIIPQILASVIFPQTAGGSQQSDVGKSILILFRIMLQVFLLLILATFLIGPSLFITVFGHSFNNVQLPFLLLLPGIFSISVTVLLAAFFSGNGHVKLNVTGTAIGLAVVLITDVLLVPKYGIIGAAIASTIGYSAFLVYALYYFRKMHAFTIKEMFAFSKSDWLWVKHIVLPQKHQA
jgi:O-antigen/teichoic acid export membrane protein